jgi:hypothetical protein
MRYLNSSNYTRTTFMIISKDLRVHWGKDCALSCESIKVRRRNASKLQLG